ncbi:MAG: PAS domain-containing protein [Planctomycetia bacterium]|nr:MAG: PAS domain-containing protein [Planctomycetia bacterium]
MSTPQQSAGTGSAARSPGPAHRSLLRREPLALFGAVVATLLVAALGACAIVLTHTVAGQERQALARGAPTIMKLLIEQLSDAGALTAEAIERNLRNAAQLPGVYRSTLRLENAAPAGGGAGERREYSFGPNDIPAGALQLESSIECEEQTGRLVVVFAPESGAWLSMVSWSGAGGVAIVALLTFAGVYRAVNRRLRTLQFVRDNLLAYHAGIEQSVELLALQGRSTAETEAWNSMIEFIRGMQQELDGHRARQAVVGSMHSMQSHGARAILDALPIGVLRIDAEGRLAYANDAAGRLLSLNEAEEPASLAERCPTPALADALNALCRSASGAGVDHRLEFGGGYSIVRMMAMPVRPLGDDEVIVTLQDVTQLKEAERSREEFLAHITHELRTPLTNIRAYSETLNEDFFDDEQTRRECYDVIMSETRRLSKLIEDVLSASQIDAGVARLNREAIRVDQSLRKAVQEVQASADSKNVGLSLKLPSKLPAALGDGHRLHQVWINLIGNAVKYTPSGGTVQVEAEGQGETVRIRVIDTGIGIPKEFHERIFEKFFRVSDSRVEAEEGTGLGLSITREIVRLHGGSIGVESEPGAGTTIIVDLPVARESQKPSTGEARNGADRRS